MRRTIGRGGLLISAGSANKNQTVVLGASGVIPDGVGKGDVLITGGTNVANNTATLDLHGFNETINGLNSAGTDANARVTTAVAGATTLTVGGGNANGSFGGIISDGSGSVALQKIGTGMQTLFGANTAAGDATIDGGTLVIGTSSGGSWAGNIIANSGGTLKGQGTITGAVTINSGATLTPQTIFSGSSGFIPTQGQQFTVIRAGSLTGQFSTIDNSGNPARLTFLPVYSSTELNLFAVYSSLASSLTNLNPNQRAVAQAIDSFQPTVISTSSGLALPDNERIHLAMTGLSDEGLKNVIEQMNPEKLQALHRVSQSVGAQVHSQVGRQLQIRRDLNPAQGDLSIYDRNGQTVYEPVAGVDSRSLFFPKRNTEKLSFFASVNGEQGEVSPSENRTNFDYWSATALYGGNYAFTREWNFGIFVGYGHTDTSLGGSGGDILYNTGKIGGYAAWKRSELGKMDLQSFGSWSLLGSLCGWVS